MSADTKWYLAPRIEYIKANIGALLTCEAVLLAAMVSFYNDRFTTTASEVRCCRAWSGMTMSVWRTSLRRWTSLAAVSSQPFCFPIVVGRGGYEHAFPNSPPVVATSQHLWMRIDAESSWISSPLIPGG